MCENFIHTFDNNNRMQAIFNFTLRLIGRDGDTLPFSAKERFRKHQIYSVNIKFGTKFIISGVHSYPTSTRRHGNFAGVHTLLRIILSSNSAVLINIITGVSPPHFDFFVFYVLCQC
jgi:hypothetical protein